MRVDVRARIEREEMSKIRSIETVRLYLGDDEVLVGYKDMKWFGEYKFYVVQGRGRSKYLYANVVGKNRTIQIHQLIMQAPDGLEVDHINGNGLDNRRENLRIVTHQENQSNLPKRKNCSSNYYGVYLDRLRGSWVCQITHKGKTVNLGRFDSEISAAVCYNNEVIKRGLADIKRINSL